MAELTTCRAAAAYRLTFDQPATNEPVALAHKLADILTEFPHTTELRNSCDEGSGVVGVVYVMLPVDVTPEMLDRKAEALRARWLEQGRG